MRRRHGARPSCPASFPSGRALAAAAWLAALALPALVQAQTVVRGPYLQSGTPSSVIVKWRTDDTTDSVVRYGLAPDSLTLSATNSDSTTEHAVQLTGLSDDAKYFYSVGTSSGTLAGGDDDHFVVTAPEPGTAKPTRIWVIGCSGTATANAGAVRDAFLNFTGPRDPDLWIMLGDNAYGDGTDAEYQSAVFEIYPQVLPRTVLWPTLGNHDGHAADSTTESGPYYDIFSLPRNGEAGGAPSGTEAYYSFDYGNIHFIVLDSYETDRSPDGAMMTWLEADLTANDKEWVIAFWHHPPYSKGTRDSDTEERSIELRQNAVPLLERYGVDLVLAAHSHSYERSHLIDGHYGLSETFTDAMKKSPGDGSATGDGAYQKPATVAAPHAGTVYVVAGSSGKRKSGPFDHPAMAVSMATLGSMVLDVNGSRLDAMFLDSLGNILDDFTILKVNAAPTFDSPAAFDAAENQTAAGTVVASDVDSEDRIERYDITGGADQAFFSIIASSGDLEFDAAPNFEAPSDTGANNTYVVVVQATGGTGEREKTATQTITVTVTDVNTEAPGRPAAPDVSAASATSLSVSWSAPDNAGPAITDYDHRHRTSPAGSWTEVTGTTSTALSATIAGLAEGTSYDVQVRATNDEGTGAWSESGTESTDANAAPSFDSPAAFDAAENQTAAGTVVASDGDSEDRIERYDITGGADQALFMVIASSGDLEFREAPNFEDAKDSDTDNDYVVEVQATSGAGTREKTATQTVTVTVTDAGGEAPGRPAAPNVSAASVTSLTVNWSAPDNAGPAITDYDVQYREGTSGGWTDGNYTGTATTATLSGLSENTSHQVQVRATNDEGTGSWSDSGSGATDANAAPSFDSPAAFDAAENQTAAGTVVASDGDSEDRIERYDITGGADQALFMVIASSGDLEFRDAPNFEDAQDQDTNNTYVVEVQATSGTGTREKTATQTITVSVTDVGGEAPGRPAAPNVSSASATSLAVNWSAPDNAGPAITDYDVQYRAGTSGDWTDAGHNGTAITATLTGLAEDTSHQVQVRATNDEGTGDWSDSGTGSTDANAAPSFDSPSTFNAAENQTAAGTVVASDSDSEDRIERYDITGGADQALFMVIASSGDLEFRDAPSYEDAKDQGTDNTYVVVVQATSGTGERRKTATQAITVTVTDVGGEAPGRPAAPDVSAASATSLTVGWSAPANAGPAITDYDHRHRTASPAGSWTEVTDTAIAGTGATIAGLPDGASYDVQVRATNDEGTGAWSDSGSGATVAHAVPTLDTRTVVEGNEVILTYDRMLDGGSVPVPEDFEVVVGGAPTGGSPSAGALPGTRNPASRGEAVSVVEVVVDGTEVRLTLDRAVAHGERVTVSYTPGTNPIRDAAGATAAAIVGEVAAETLVSAMDAAAVEEGGTAVFEVTLSRAVEEALTVAWTLADVTAVAGDDYPVAQSGTLTIAADEDRGTVEVTTIDDGAAEDDETFTLMLTEPSDFPYWAHLKDATAFGTIVDNDARPDSEVGPVVEREIDDQTLEVGEALDLDVRLNFRDPEQPVLDYGAESADPSVATVAADGAGVLTIRGVKRGVTAVTVTAANRRDGRAADTFAVTVGGPALVALMPRASDPVRQGFVRLINHGAEAGEVSIEAVDDTGVRRGPVALSVGAGATAHFNSDDLEDGNAAKGLPEGVGPGEGDWRLVLDGDLDFEVLAYVRTVDGALAGMHDVVPVRDGRHRVAIFNPGGNPNQVSRLRLVNPGGADAEVAVEGIDDAGASPGTTVGFDLPAGRSTTLTAAQLESGAGVDGALGDGVGKWRLTVTSTEPIVAMSLLSSPTGHLTNLSTLPRAPGEAGEHVVPLFPAASDALGRQGFVRVVNRSGASGTVSVEAHDDGDLAYPGVTLSLDAGQTRHFNSDDLELGNAAKGLAGSTGSGVGDWRLVLSSDLDIEVLAYIRTADGFLTSMHEVAPLLLGERRVATFNPGGNPNQVSRLRLVNPGAEDAQVTITGIDDAGASPGGPVTVTVPAGASRTLAAADLEAGADGFAGALGDGVGKWRLAVTSAQPVIVMSLLSSPTGHLTNLSTAPDRGGD